MRIQQQDRNEVGVRLDGTEVPNVDSLDMQSQYSIRAK